MIQRHFVLCLQNDTLCGLFVPCVFAHDAAFLVSLNSRCSSKKKTTDLDCMVWYHTKGHDSHRSNLEYSGLSPILNAENEPMGLDMMILTDSREFNILQ